MKDYNFSHQHSTAVECSDASTLLNSQPRTAQARAQYNMYCNIGDDGQIWMTVFLYIPFRNTGRFLTPFYKSLNFSHQRTAQHSTGPGEEARRRASSPERKPFSGLPFGLLPK
jgi:hypothetical protein